MTHHTGLFSTRAASNGGPRPAQRYARDAAMDTLVAEALSDGQTKRQAARSIGTSVAQVDAAFRRICMRLGPQATGDWHVRRDGSVEL